MRVIGAGYPRTGTWSLKHGIERLLGGTCYHMRVLHERLDHLPAWQAAVAGEPVDWHGLLGAYVGAVDWPAGLFWRDLAEAFPDAVIVLSTRADAETWRRSADRTIFEVARSTPRPEFVEWHAFARTLYVREFGADWEDPEAKRRGYDRHVADVRANAPKDRLVEWTAADGWGPLCAALGLAEPDEPFPHLNAGGTWRSRVPLEE